MKKVILPNLPEALKLRLPRRLGADASALAEAVNQTQVQPAQANASVLTASVTRRTFIRSALAATAVAAGMTRTARADGLPPTTPDQEGPYYRAGAPFRNVLYDEADIPVPLVVYGQLRGTDKGFLTGGLIDIWQCDAAGDYDNTSPDYLGRGRQFTDEEFASWWTYGTWPGYYPGRPWHLHLRASAKGYRTLTTQLYFRDDPRQHPASLEMDWFELEDYPGVYFASFDIVLIPT